MTETYSNRQAAPLVGISDPMVGKRLKAIRAAHPGFIETTMQGKRLTDETVALLKLWADDRTEFERRASEAPATHVNATVETAPESQSAATMRRADAATSNALAVQDHTAALSKFEVPKADLEIPDIDVDDLRALLGLSTSANSEADAHRANSDAYQKQIDTLKGLKDELDEAEIIADEKARIAREKELRAKVRAADMGNDLKASVAVA